MAETGRFLFETVVARVATQKEDQAALVSRSKDLLGITSIAGAITSVVGNRGLGIDKPAAWWIWSVVFVVVFAIGCAILVMRPRRWEFTSDPTDAKKQVGTAEFAEAPMDRWYRYLADGFLDAQPRRVGIRKKSVKWSSLELHDSQIKRMGRLVSLQATALGALLILAALLLTPLQ